MRKIILAAIIACLGFTTVLISCQKEEKKYSCNEEANQYASINLNVNQSISRENLAKLDYEYQFAVFESLTPENKHRIFKEKVDYILSHKSFNSQETAALNQLKELTPSIIYGNGGEPAEVIKQWKQDAKINLGWSDQYIFENVGTWLTAEELQIMAGVYTSSNAKGSCTCQSDWACLWSGSGCNYKAGCNVTETGCGILGGAKCKGNCGNAPLSDGPIQENAPGGL